VTPVSVSRRNEALEVGVGGWADGAPGAGAVAADALELRSRPWLQDSRELGPGRGPEAAAEHDPAATGWLLGAGPSRAESSRRAAGVATGVLPVAPPATVWRPAARPAG
jgi:hypothetical protein